MKRFAPAAMVIAAGLLVMAVVALAIVGRSDRNPNAPETPGAGSAATTGSGRAGESQPTTRGDASRSPQSSSGATAVQATAPGSSAGATSGQAAPATLEPRDGGTLRLPGRTPSTLDPALVRDVTSSTYVYEIYSGLVTLSQDLEVVGDLARSWDVSNSGTRYTFHLRSDLQFQDGRGLTSADVVFSLERACDPATGSPVAATYLNDVVGCADKLTGAATSVRGVTAPDPATVEIDIDGAKAYFLSKLTYPVSFVVDRSQVASDSAWTTHPNATGPFRLTGYTPDESLTLSPNDRYWAGSPYLDAVQFNLRPVVASTLYENNELDATPVGADDLERVLDPLNPLSRQVVEGPGGLDVSYLGFNTAKPPFDNPDVRRAVYQAVDPERVARVILRDAARPAFGILPPGMPGFTEHASPLGHDPAAARASLSSAGPGTIDSPIVITIAGEGGVAEPRVEAVADDISTTLGIPVIVEQAPWETFQQELSAGTYEAWVLGWAADYADPQDFLDVLFHSGAPLNYSRYANASVDALLEQARTDADVEHRLHTYAQAERTILDDAPWVPLTSSRDVWLVKPYVHGFSAPPLVVPRLSRVWMSGP